MLFAFEKKNSGVINKSVTVCKYCGINYCCYNVATSNFVVMYIIFFH